MHTLPSYQGTHHLCVVTSSFEGIKASSIQASSYLLSFSTVQFFYNIKEKIIQVVVRKNNHSQIEIIAVDLTPLFTKSKIFYNLSKAKFVVG
jgi:hypothetical protein